MSNSESTLLHYVEKQSLKAILRNGWKHGIEKHKNIYNIKASYWGENSWGQNKPKAQKRKLMGQAAFRRCLMDTKACKKECNRPTARRPWPISGIGIRPRGHEKTSTRTAVQRSGRTARRNHKECATNQKEPIKERYTNNNKKLCNKIYCGTARTKPTSNKE